MTIYFNRNIYGFQFTGKAELEPAEAATATDPAWPAVATVYTLHIDGSEKDCIDIINPAIIQRIEAMLVEAV